MEMTKGQEGYGKSREQTFSVAGMNYHTTPSMQRQMADSLPVMVSLKREPENSHDENAIAIHLDTLRPGMMIGYVPRGVAEVLAPAMDGKRVKIETAWLTKVDYRTGTAEMQLVLRKKLPKGA